MRDLSLRLIGRIMPLTSHPRTILSRLGRMVGNSRKFQVPAHETPSLVLEEDLAPPTKHTGTLEKDGDLLVLLYLETGMTSCCIVGRHETINIARRECP